MKFNPNRKPLKYDIAKKPPQESAAAMTRRLKTTKKWGKYGAKACYDSEGDFYHSMVERDNIVEFKRLRDAGYLTDLKTQNDCAYTMKHDGQAICKYLPDAAFKCLKDFSMDSMNGPVWFRKGESYVVDIKSPPTAKNAVYKLKKKMMKIFFGIEITEIVKGKAAKKR